MTSTFRGRRPDIPPLTHELQCRTNQQPVAQATQGWRPQTTAITPTHPGPLPRHKVQPPPLGRVDRADNAAALAAQHCHPSHDEPRPNLIGPPPAMVSEAAASAHKHHLSGPPPRHPPPRRQASPSKHKLTLQGDASCKVVAYPSPSSALAIQSYGFLPESHNPTRARNRAQQQRLQEGKQRRDAAVAGPDQRPRLDFRLELLHALANGVKVRADQHHQER